MEEIKDLEFVVCEVIKENICEVLNSSQEDENNLDVSFNILGGIEIKSYGHKFFSTRRDIDNDAKYNSRFYYGCLNITDKITNSKIEKYNKFLKFITTIKSKTEYDEIIEIVEGNLYAYDNEINIMAEAK